MSKKNRGREHFVIPDTQVKPGVYIDHLEAAGHYIVDKKPDVVVHLGDHFDMHSLSSYDRKTLHAEGARYELDIQAGQEAMDELFAPINEENARRAKKGLKLYKPEYHFLLGNHEERISRHVVSNQELEGKLSFDDLELESYGWTVHDFRKPIILDGVAYAHFFYNQGSGAAIGGTCHYKLNKLGFSFTMGHQQGLDQAMKPLNNGSTLRGLVAGSFYQHDEDYKGPQANDHWRGCVYKHEVVNGNYDIMELSIDYLMEEWL